MKVSRSYENFSRFYEKFSRYYEKVSRSYENFSRYYEKYSRYYENFYSFVRENFSLLRENFLFLREIFSFVREKYFFLLLFLTLVGFRTLFLFLFFFFFFFWLGFKIRKKFRNRLDSVTFYDFIVEPTYGERDIVVTTSVRCMCVRASVRICPGINLYIYERISK